MDGVIPMGKLAVALSKESESERIQSAGLDILGAMYEHYKMYDSALVVYSKMLSLSQKLKNDRLVYWSYYHLGINQAGKGNTDSALFYFKKQYNYDVFNSEKWGAYMTLNEISKIFQISENIDSAMVFFDNMITISKQSKDPNLILDAYMTNIYFYGKLDKPGKLVELLDEALAIAESTLDVKAQVKIYLQIAYMFSQQKKNYEVAIKYYQKVLDLTSPDEKILKASLLNEIGVSYLKGKKDNLAFESIRKALNYAEEAGNRYEISKAYMNFGKIYYSRNEFTKAIENFKTSLEMGCDYCSELEFQGTLISIADAYLKLNQPDQALEYIIEASKLADSYNLMAISNLRLGNYYNLTNPSQSEKYYLDAFELAERGQDINTIKTISDTLSTFFSAKHDYKAAYLYQSRSMELNDSITKINQQADMASWEFKFEMEKTKQANKLSIAEIKRQKIFRNSLLIIAMLLIGFGFLIYISYRIKKNDNILLTGQKKRIEEKNQKIQAQIEEITLQKNKIEKISNELHEADAMKLRFFSNLSHEFRTPLTLILNPARELLETSALKGDSKKQLDYIYTNAIKLDNLTKQIMELQKLDAGKLQLNNDEDDIITYCTGLISSFESLCDIKKLKIRLQTNYSSAIVLFDKDKTGKIITNLLSNAIKFSFQETTIDVKIEIASGWFHLDNHRQGCRDTFQ